tara:strand:- start:1133 stop:1588 length:456 start_codon:yes stop_codon:yes gene_type:complete
MERVNITYSVPEWQITDTLNQLIDSSEWYIEEFSKTIQEARNLLMTENPEGCVKALANSRDHLAEADFRLHDVMNCVIQLTQQRQPTQAPVPHEHTHDHVDPPVEQVDKLDKVRERMAEVRKNIDDLGIELPEEELNKIMGRLNDQASRGV